MWKAVRVRVVRHFVDMSIVIGLSIGRSRGGRGALRLLLADGSDNSRNEIGMLVEEALGGLADLAQAVTEHLVRGFRDVGAQPVSSSFKNATFGVGEDNFSRTRAEDDDDVQADFLDEDVRLAEAVAAAATVASALVGVGECGVSGARAGRASPKAVGWGGGMRLLFPVRSWTDFIQTGNGICSILFGHNLYCIRANEIALSFRDTLCV